MKLAPNNRTYVYLFLSISLLCGSFYFTQKYIAGLQRNLQKTQVGLNGYKCFIHKTFVSDQSSLGELIDIELKWDYNNHGSLHFVVLSKQPVQINTGNKIKFAPPVGLRFAPPVTMPAVDIRI